MNNGFNRVAEISVLYWVVFTLTGTLGTAMCDYMDRTLNVGYALGSIVLVVVLIMTLAIWRLSEKTLSVKNVSTSRAELFYWFTNPNTRG